MEKFEHKPNYPDGKMPTRGSEEYAELIKKKGLVKEHKSMYGNWTNDRRTDFEKEAEELAKKGTGQPIDLSERYKTHPSKAGDPLITGTERSGDYSQPLDFRSQDEIDDEDFVDKNDPLRNYVPIEEVSDQSDEYESFGETHELGRDLEDEEYHNQAAILAKKQEIEDLERYGRKISEREMSDLGSIKADERKNETLQRLYPEDNPQAFNKSMKGHLSSGEMIDHWEKRDFSKRNSVHKNYKLQKKKEAYRAARNIAEPRKGFFGKLKELFSEDDKSDKSEAA